MNKKQKEEILIKYYAFIADNDATPNALFVHIKMNNAHGYDTPYFSGYVIIDKNAVETDDFSNYEENEVLYYVSSIDEFISDMENGDTYFTLISIENFDII